MFSLAPSWRGMGCLVVRAYDASVHRGYRLVSHEPDDLDDGSVNVDRAQEYLLAPLLGNEVPLPPRNKRGVG